MPEIKSEDPSIPAILKTLVCGNHATKEFAVIRTRQTGNGRYYPAVTWWFTEKSCDSVVKYHISLIHKNHTFLLKTRLKQVFIDKNLPRSPWITSNLVALSRKNAGFSWCWAAISWKTQEIDENKEMHVFIYIGLMETEKNNVFIKWFICL